MTKNSSRSNIAQCCILPRSTIYSRTMMLSETCSKLSDSKMLIRPTSLEYAVLSSVTSVAQRIKPCFLSATECWLHSRVFSSFDTGPNRSGIRPKGKTRKTSTVFGRGFCMVSRVGLEPTAHCLKGNCSKYGLTAVAHPATAIRFLLVVLERLKKFDVFFEHVFSVKFIIFLLQNVYGPARVMPLGHNG